MIDKIFKAYDIRGLYPTELNGKIAYNITRAIIEILKPKSIVIGKDTRIGSEDLKKSMIAAFTQYGIKVYDIGLTTTDALSYATTIQQINPDIGLMITASHNPKNYNGIKILKKNADAIESDELSLIKEKTKELKDMKIDENIKHDLVIKYDIMNNFVSTLVDIIDNIEIFHNLKVIIDISNGSAGSMIKEVFNRFNLDVDFINFEPDGNFPNHDPDPTKDENIEELGIKIKVKNYDIGIAFDGDGDRAVILDEKGNKISGSIVGSIIAEYLLKHYNKKKILYNSVCSWIVPETIKKNNGEPIITPVGQINIKKIFKKQDALFAIETSGHYNFYQLNGIDSGILSSLYILLILAKEKSKNVNLKMSEIVKKYKKYYSIPEKNYRAENRDKIHDIIKELKHMYDDGKQITIDGLRVEYNDWWFSVRASNTEPLLRLNLEAKTKDILDIRTKEIINVIERMLSY